MVPQEAFYMAIGPMGKCSLETLMQNLSCHCNKKKEPTMRPPNPAEIKTPRQKCKR